MLHKENNKLLFNLNERGEKADERMEHTGGMISKNMCREYLLITSYPEHEENRRKGGADVNRIWSKMNRHWAFHTSNNATTQNKLRLDLCNLFDFRC